MPALTRYKRRAAIYCRPVQKRARYSYASGYRNSKSVYNAARKIGTMWRRYKKRQTRQKFSTRNIGLAPNTGTAKRFTILNDQSNFASRGLFTTNLVEIPQTTTNAINQRQRNIVNISGFKICLEVRNNTESPLVWNWAIISPRDSVGITLSDFFRGNGTTRGVDFSDALSSCDINHRAINSDNFYILKRGKFTLVQVGTGSNPTTGFTTRTGFNYIQTQRYFKLNRQIRYDGPNGNNVETKSVFFVHWADNILVPEGTAAVADAYTLRQHLVTYFREPKC